MTHQTPAQTARIAELEHSDAVALRFRALADLPWPVWLDSSARGGPDGRYDILAADPSVTLRTRGPITEIAARDGRVESSRESPFALLRERLGARLLRRSKRCRSAAARSAISATTSAGGSSGCRPSRPRTFAMPDLAVGIYDWAVIVDHEARRTWLVGRGRDPRTFERWQELVARLESPRAARPASPFRVLSRASSSFSRPQYAEAFRNVQRHIRDGDCYQVNLTQRFKARAEGDAWHAYLRLREINPAPFAAYLDLPDGKVAELIARAVPARDRRPRRDETDQGHAAALRGSRARSRARRGAAREPEGPRRERDDRGPLAQRPRQELRAGVDRT